jgi:hypothetical protein
MAKTSIGQNKSGNSAFARYSDEQTRQRLLDWCCPLVASHNFGSELGRDLMAWRVVMRSATLER